MSVKKLSHLLFHPCFSKHMKIILPFIFALILPLQKSFATTDDHAHLQAIIAQQLGWVKSKENNCGGYYLEQAFATHPAVSKTSPVFITGNQALLSQRATSILQNVTITRDDQQITADTGYLYRQTTTRQFSVIDMIENVHVREPNTLIIGEKGSYHFKTNSKLLTGVLYRTSLQNGRQIAGPHIAGEDIRKPHKITLLTAWGKAHEFSQTEPKIYELSQASYSTCPPIQPTWQVKASHIVLNKNTGRGYATHARLYLKNLPVFYTPYINFPLDRRRKTGFLWPTIGGSNQWGPYFLLPFYWNLAPNYDTTITMGLLTKRGVQLSDIFRYLTPLNSGRMDVSVLPNDKLFAIFQKKNKENPPATPPGQPISVTQAELNRLLNSSTTRKSFFWRDDAQFDEHWSSHIDFNYAGDDYYLRDFGSNLNEITQNQLLQEADLYYKSQNWNFTGRVQAYQTLHPLDENLVLNQYRRFPQLILNADYPDKPLGFEYFINNELTHFDLRNTPGTTTNLPIGNRMHIQPGISLPLFWPYFYINPRIQLSMTQYQLYQTTATQTPSSARRSIPIFDIASGLFFTQDISFFHRAFQQTLEPQIYYTYVPYRNQVSIPIFDTTVSALTYDQIFNYNRFSGIDRIGDANQIGVGVTTRLIDQETGFEKVRLGVGELVYFANRHVTLCNNPTICSDNPTNPNLTRRLSPLSGFLRYNVNASWNFSTDTIWNPITKQLDNATLGLHYEPETQHIINVGYSYGRGTDPLSGLVTTNAANNLKVTDFSFAWPVVRDISAVGRWTQNWNHAHLQNLLYGLQYDTCCWAVRLVAGRAFVGFDPNQNNAPKYNAEFYIQFSLKGLGDIGSGNPDALLSSITGYNTHFGQDL